MLHKCGLLIGTAIRQAEQEILPNAKVNARQSTQGTYCWLEKYTFSGLLSPTIRVYLHSFSLSNLRNRAKFSENSNFSSSRSFKVIVVSANGKRTCNFLLVINSNFGRISYRFRDIGAFSSKIARFPTRPCLTSRGTPCDIKIIYTSLKSAFNGQQFHRWQYGSIYILLLINSNFGRISYHFWDIDVYS